jgi:hypothetical protein
MTYYTIEDTNQTYKHRNPMLAVGNKRYGQKVSMSMFIGDEIVFVTMERPEAATLLRKSKVININRRHA